MVELTLQGILSTPFEPKGITAGKSVYHVPERVFRMSPVYTRFALAPGFHIPRLWRLKPNMPQRHKTVVLCLWFGLASKGSSRTWKRSVPPAVAGGCAALKQVGAVTARIRNNRSNEVIERRLMATHPPATAGGTDLFQVRLLIFEAKPLCIIVPPLVTALP